MFLVVLHDELLLQAVAEGTFTQYYCMSFIQCATVTTYKQKQGDSREKLISRWFTWNISNNEFVLKTLLDTVIILRVNL